MPVDGSSAATRISGALPPDADVESVIADSTGQYAVYAVDALTDGQIELFRVPIGGGPALRLNAPFPSPSHDVRPAIGAAPGGRVLYLASTGLFGRNELYSVPADGSTSSVRLNPPLGGDRVLEFELNGNAPGRVFFLTSDAAGISNPTESQLYSAPLDGRLPAVRHSTGVPRSILDWDVMPDGKRVVWVGDPEGGFLEQVFVAPITPKERGQGRGVTGPGPTR